jgi:hypothetical protein
MLSDFKFDQYVILKTYRGNYYTTARLPAMQSPLTNSFV